MRVHRRAVLAAGASWPDSEQRAEIVPDWSWIHVENRGGSDVLVNTGVMPINAPDGYWMRVPALSARTRNFAGPHDAMGEALHILNVGGAQTTIAVELADSPIVDILSALAPAGATGATPGATVATGQVAVGTAATLILPVNSTRRSAVITNTGTSTVYVGAAGVTVGTGEAIPAGASITFTNQNAVSGIVSTGTVTVTYYDEST